MESNQPLPERRESLWMLILGPALWAVHFMFCYGLTAVYCARWTGREGSLLPVRWAIAAATLIALLGIAAVGWAAYRRHSYGSAALPHDFPTAEDRHRFLGFSTLLLCLLSAVATIYVALPALFIESCR